jgi:hypothetical protein
MFYRCLALAVFCVAIAGQADGATLTYNTTTPIASTLTDWQSSLAFPKFDSSLGTLLSVRLDLSGQFDTVLTVKNIGSAPTTGESKTEVAITVQDSGNNLSVPELDLYSSIFVFTDLPAGGTITSGTIHKSGGSSDLYTNSAVLSEFTGLGSTVLPASTLTKTWVNYTSGNAAASQVTSASLTGSVTYTYNVIPEPSMIALLGIAGIGLLCIRRDRKS